MARADTLTSLKESDVNRPMKRLGELPHAKLCYLLSLLHSLCDKASAHHRQPLHRLDPSRGLPRRCSRATVILRKVSSVRKDFMQGAVLHLISSFTSTLPVAPPSAIKTPLYLLYHAR